ncbi:unnamed protein product, partial [Closterium sp. NIES-53]
MNTIRSSAKHEVATGLDLKSASGADLPCVSCVGGKLARHTFPDQGSDTDDVLTVVHVDLCGPFRVAAKDGILGSGSVSWRSTRSSSVLSSSCEAEIYAGAMAAQELRWLTYLLTDLGEQPRSPPVLYVDNKAMLALCREHRLEHRTKHIALRYFLARELQQRGQLCLAYVASQANMRPEVIW